MDSEIPVVENEDKPAVFQRLDERKLNEYRLLKIKFGHEWGNCTVTLGDTQIMVQLFHNIVCPDYFKPNEGQFQISLKLAGQSQFSTETTKIKAVLESFYKQSKFIDLEALCITVGEKVWNIVVDLSVMTMDGNVVGCSSIAILASLMYFRYLDVTVQNASVEPLSFHQQPVITSFAIFENNNIIVMDPSSVEESKCKNQMFVGFNDKGKFCGVKKEDGVDLSFVNFMNCLNSASTVTYRILDYIKSAVNNAIKDRSSSSTSAQSLESTLTKDFLLKLNLSDHSKTLKLFNKDKKNEEIKEAVEIDGIIQEPNESNEKNNQKPIINNHNEINAAEADSSTRYHPMIINPDAYEYVSSDTDENKVQEVYYEVDNDGVVVILD